MKTEIIKQIVDIAEACHVYAIQPDEFKERLIIEIHTLTNLQLRVLADVLSQDRA